MNTFYKKTTRFLKIQKLYRSNKEVPTIRLEGQWITKIGFEVGESVSINIRERLLIIMPIERALKESISYKNQIQTIKNALKEFTE